MQNSRPIRVKISAIEMGFVRATSVDLPGLYSAARSVAILVAALPSAIIELLETDGNHYELGEPEQLTEDTYLWRATAVVSPIRLLRRAC